MGRFFEFGESRGVDRVPERLRVRRPEPIVIHDSSVIDVRRRLTKRGIRTTEVRSSYVNPARDAKSLKSGRLRKELR